MYAHFFKTPVYFINVIKFCTQPAGQRKTTDFGRFLGDQEVAPQKKEFVSEADFHKSFGYHPSSVWVKLNFAPENIRAIPDPLLVIKNPLLWSSSAQTQSGNLKKFSNFPFPAFQMNHLDASGELYVRLKSDAALNLNFEVMSTRDYNTLSKLNISVYAAYGAIVLLLAGFFFAYFVSTKKKAALAYTAELVCFHFFAIISLFGVPLLFLPEELHYFGTSFIVISECLACISTIWFTVELIKKPFGRSEALLVLLACVTGIISLFIQNIYMMSLTLVICVMTIGITIKTFYQSRDQNPYLQSYLVSFCFLSAGVFLYTSDYLGFTDNFNNRLYVFIGSLAELSIITVTLTKIFYQEQTQLQYYAATLGGLVSQSTLQDMMNNKEPIAFDTVSTDLTVIFVDIVGYTEASKTLQNPRIFEKDIQQLLHFIRTYVIESGGEVNKTLGDGLLGYFGHSISGKKMDNHAQLAIQCALRIQRASVVWINQNKFHFPYRLRIGLSTGECRIGNIALDRLDYTITGDTVVMAQRMESACSPLKILASENVIQKMSSLPEKIHEKLIHMKNQKNLVAAYEIDPFKGVEDYEKFYQMALNQIRTGNLKKRSTYKRFAISNAVAFEALDPQAIKFDLIDISEGGMLLKTNIDISKNVQLVGKILERRIGCVTRWSQQTALNEYVIGTEFIRINVHEIDEIFAELTQEPSLKLA